MTDPQDPAEQLRERNEAQAQSQRNDQRDDLQAKIDFWHADAPGRPRFHSPREPFLPSFGEIEAHAAAAIPGARVEALSPYRRLQFHQSSRHWWGRMFARPADLFLKLILHRRFRFLASGWLNPFLVVRITKAL